MIIIYGLSVLLLAICSYEDIRDQRFSIRYPMIFGVLILVVQLLLLNQSMINLLSGISVGVCFLVMGLISHGRIGYGDGILVCVTGLSMGFWDNLNMLYYALIAAAITSVLLIIFKKYNRKQSIPFVPFLLVSYLFSILKK